MQSGRASAQFPAAEAPEQQVRPRIVADVATLLEIISLAPTFDAGRFRQERNIRKS
jgi:hypothetical protein